MDSLGWKNPAFLLAMALAVLPILIHLLGRKRIEQVTFGAFRFLRKHAERVVRRHRLLEFLLLLCRCLALAALALAFAYPFLRSLGENARGAAAGVDTAVLILVDNSYSMKGPGHLEDARRRAGAVLDSLPGNVAAGVATLNTTLKVLAPLASERAGARAALEKIQPSLLATNLNHVLAEAGQLLALRPVSQRRVVLISDMAMSAWDRKEPLNLPPGLALQTEPVSAKDSNNLCVRQVSVPPVVLAGGFDQEIAAEIVNQTAQQCPGVVVHFFLSGKEVEKRVVNLKPKSASPVSFRQHFETPGELVGKIAIDSKDDYPEDNERTFVVNVLPRVQVLLLNGNPGLAPAQNDGFFLAKALSPDSSSPIAVREEPADRWNPAGLKGVDVVMLTGVNKLPEAAVTALEKFVRDGGGIAFFMGQRVVADEFNASLGRLLPCKARETQEAPLEQPLSISLVDFSHEIFQPFDGPHNGNFAAARFTKYFEVKDSQTAQVLARFNPLNANAPAGAPVLLAKALGRGRVVLFTSSACLNWNDFCLKTIFLPFVQEMTKWLCRQRLLPTQNRLAGQAVRYMVQGQVSEAALRAPSGATEKLPVSFSSDADSRGARPGVVEFTPLECGLYSLTYGSETTAFAVNLVPEELDAARFDARELVSAAAAQQHAAVAEMADKGTLPKDLERPLWMAALFLVCLLLGLEMILATYLAKS